MYSYKYLLAALAVLDTSSAVQMHIRGGDALAVPVDAVKEQAKELNKAVKKAAADYEAALKAQKELKSDAAESEKKAANDAVNTTLAAKEAAEKARDKFEAENPNAFTRVRAERDPDASVVAVAPEQSWYTIWWYWLIIGLVLAGLGAGIFFYMRK